MPRAYDHSLLYLQDIVITHEGQEFRARRNPRASNTYVVKLCEHCACLFPTIKSEIGREGRGRYCSTRCASHDNNPSGEQHPMWKGGTNTAEKLHCRQTLQRAVRNGSVIRQPCEVCAQPNAHAHHDDYTKPFQVKWLCQKHHNELHANQ